MSTQTPAKTSQTFSSTELAERTPHRRAIEAIIWGIPVVNFNLMFQARPHQSPADRDHWTTVAG